jgi:hypothetical protein
MRSLACFRASKHQPALTLLRKRQINVLERTSRHLSQSTDIACLEIARELAVQMLSELHRLAYAAAPNKTKPKTHPTWRKALHTKESPQSVGEVK